ncbi:histidine kinase,histidine kinase,PAS domain-containing protein,Response regulator receiver domain protein [Terriglobus roseus DSM 18391]|uniref:histidine kinase n=1 Tax=Terriglobus roseus (strain DSM 18391 / NRRL B-41598 / KBS 63) TaxID=926566 RepID=I3ZBA4_TERRK|nr:response regulator [Terriglobus roseus]AFL86522.1 histidine kinase,histidine kinase,PAS domain-containing protein,Response regulator receiver domain protein [Terriglobus roseus DSM 18391]
MSSDRGSGRILLIDDQEATRYVFRRILTRAGYTVEEAETGREGMAKAMMLPDLVICDVNLPDMLGYDVSRRLKSNPLTLNIPVLQISAAFVSDESRVQALDGGADSYLTQPVEATVLVAQVNALLRMRRAESLSSLSALQWKTTFDALSDGVALANADGVLVRVNSTFLSLMEMVSSDAEGTLLAKIFEEKFTHPFAEFLQKGALGAPTEIVYRDRWLRVRYDRIRTDANIESGLILLVTDITDQKKLQETLKLSERLAATGRLAHVIAHEINNPLEAMQNLLYLAQMESTPPEDVQDYVHQASSELTRISQITKQVLAYHRGSSQPVMARSDEILQSVLAIFRSMFLNGRVDLDAKTGCAVSLMVHPGEIRQVLSNIISNALDALGGTRGSRLCARCIQSTEVSTGRRGVRFLFSDNGPGIPEEILPRIFEAFYTTKESKGSGVGLWLSAEVIGKHRGSVRVRTRTAGKFHGTIFDVFLPLPMDDIQP